MKTILLIHVLLLCAITGFTQRGYVHKALKNDIEKKQEATHEDERVKGEKAVDERLDAWDESDKKSREKIQAFPTMSLTMVMEFPEKPKSNMSITYYYKEYNCASVMKFENTTHGSSMDRTIMNFKEGKSTMLMTDKKGRKTGMRMELKTIDWVAKVAIKKDNAQLANGEASLKTTNEYKIIEGYKCRKYIHETEKYTTELWVTTESKIDYMQLNRALYHVFAGTGQNQNAYFDAGMKGIAIQTHLIPKDGHSQECIMTMEDINAGYAPAEMFSTDGYDVKDMPTIRNVWDGYKEDK